MKRAQKLSAHVLWLGTKHGFITGIPAQSRSQCNGSTRRRQRLLNFVSNRLPARLWRQCFGTATEFYLLNIWHTSLLWLLMCMWTLWSLWETHSTIEKRRGLLSRGVMMLHDNAPVHKAKKVQTAIAECGFQEMNHPPYSPDLAPCDYFLFRHLKKHLAGTSIFKWHWHSSRCNVVAGGSGFWLLSCSNVIASGQVEQVHWIQWRLCWKIMQCYFVKPWCIIFR